MSFCSGIRGEERKVASGEKRGSELTQRATETQRTLRDARSRALRTKEARANSIPQRLKPY
jgi:hypothetical protein